MPASYSVIEKNRGKIIKVNCAICNISTNHTTLFQINETYSERDIFAASEHITVQCLGCDSVSYIMDSYNSEEFDHDEDGNSFMTTTRQIFPPRIPKKMILEHAHYAPNIIYNIYVETFSALCNENSILAGIGIRAIIEAICKEKKIESGNLKFKINQLKTDGLITEDEKNYLHSLRFMGNDAAHEIKAHKVSDLLLAFTIAEHLITKCYIIPKLADDLPQHA